MEKKLKSNIKNHFFYNWYFYVILILVISLFITWLTNLKTRNQPHEMVTLFSGVAKVEENLTKEVIISSSSTIRETKLLDFNPNDSNFGTILVSAGTYNTDFMIVPTSKVNGSFCAQYTLDLARYKEKFDTLGNFSYLSFEYEGVNRVSGIEVYNEDTGINLLDSFFTYKMESFTFKQYALFINLRSPNFDSVFLYGNNHSNNAFKALEAMFSYNRK